VAGAEAEATSHTWGIRQSQFMLGCNAALYTQVQGGVQLPLCFTFVHHLRKVA